MAHDRVVRQFPRIVELAPLLRMAPRTGSRVERRVARAVDIAGLREIGRRRTPRAVFDYVDGAATEEHSMRRSVAAFGRVEFSPRVLRDVANVSTQTPMLGKPSAMPFAFAPTGFTRMMHAEGERAVARVAARAGIPYALSTMGTTSIEDVAGVSGDGRRWFQLYVWRDRERSRMLIERAQAAGYDALILTVDVPVPGARLRDSRHGLTIPPTLTARTFLDGVLHPRWLADFLTTPPVEFASLKSGTTKSMAVDQIAATLFDPSVEMADLAWFREVWDGPIVVKGLMTVEDAVALADLGVDAIVVSNHGGRQLDRSVTPLELLGDVVAEVGSRLEVWVDTGVRSGADVVAAIAMGARAVLVGRAYLYGLMAGGEAGVQRALDILAADVRRTMALLGVTSVAELTPAHARLRDS
jgi:L-lactate dehydrogenase (cytochrome)